MLNEEEGWIAEFEAAGEDEVRIRLYRGSGSGHKNIQHTVRRAELSPDRFRDFWRD